MIYPFGHGISYTTFSLQWSPSPPHTTFHTADDSTTFSVNVTNTGSVYGNYTSNLPFACGRWLDVDRLLVFLAADEVVLLFLKPKAHTIPSLRDTGTPVVITSLMDFERVHLKPGASSQVTFTVNATALGLVDSDGHTSLHPGAYDIVFSRGCVGCEELTAEVAVDAPSPLRLKSFRKWWTPALKHDDVAAHSTVRALYGGYDGPLYQVRRASDNATWDISVLLPGGVANAYAQDMFCENTDCIIYRIFDQSPQLNHLDLSPHRGGPPGPDKGVNARKQKVTVGGHSVYGAYFEKQMGYRNANTSGIATGDDPESMYMVTGGRVYNTGCCFDYGNAEVDLSTCRGQPPPFSNATGAGWTNGTGSGPWVRADLEDGLWAGNQTTVNQLNAPIDADYVTAMLKGQANRWALKGGDAQSGRLKTLFEGDRPIGYVRMKKEGAIILGIGGDGGDDTLGIFFEGIMTSGYAKDVTDDLVQANIVAAGYGHRLKHDDEGAQQCSGQAVTSGRLSACVGSAGDLTSVSIDGGAPVPLSTRAGLGTNSTNASGVIKTQRFTAAPSNAIRWEIEIWSDSATLWGVDTPETGIFTDVRVPSSSLPAQQPNFWTGYGSWPPPSDAGFFEPFSLQEFVSAGNKPPFLRMGCTL